ncbi:MAG TPA: hypothetical protein VIJ42_07795 [Stellaceae bacterium]
MMLTDDEIEAVLKIMESLAAGTDRAGFSLESAGGGRAVRDEGNNQVSSNGDEKIETVLKIPNDLTSAEISRRVGSTDEMIDYSERPSRREIIKQRRLAAGGEVVRRLSGKGYRVTEMKLKKNKKDKLTMAIRERADDVLSWSWIVGQVGSRFKVYSGC